MTDPRAALAEHLMTVYPFDSDTAHIVIEDLAERGVLLVTEAERDEALREAWVRGFRSGLANEVDDWNATDEQIRKWAAAYVAALSGKVRIPGPDIETLAAIKIAEAQNRGD